MPHPAPSPWQFSLRSLLAAIVLSAVACVALLNANPWWASGCVTGAYALVTAAILLAIYGDPARRPYWLGFAVSGGVYLVLETAMSGFGMSDELITQRALDKLYPLFPWKEPKDDGELSLAFIQGGTMTAAETVYWTSFRSVGHAFFALLAALVGGAFSAGLSHRRSVRPHDACDSA